MDRLKDKKAIVTGAARGLGEAIVEHLASEGCDVVAWDIDFEQVQETAAKAAEKTGMTIRGEKVDVTDTRAVKQGVDNAVKSMGGLDIMVANAGINISGGSVDYHINNWRKVLEVNLVGWFLCAREAARIMLPQKSGSIIQINSKSGRKGSFKNHAYAASSASPRVSRSNMLNMVYVSMRSAPAISSIRRCGWNSSTKSTPAASGSQKMRYASITLTWYR
jgi:sorbitol-6-phosphate 2-dehydrogenase